MAGYDDSSLWALQTTGGIKYRSVRQSGTVSRHRNGSIEEMQETVIILASSLEAYIDECFPAPLYQNGIPVWVNRPFPGAGHLRAKNLTWKEWVEGLPVDPFTSDNAAPALRASTYQPCVEVTVTYDNEYSDVDINDPQTYLEISASAAGEFLHVPSPTSSWETADDPNLDEANPVSVVVPETEWSLRWSFVPAEFWNETLLPRLRIAMGKVNSDDVPLLANAKAETLLFVGYEMQQEFRRFRPGAITQGETDPNDGLYIELTLKILEKRVVDGADEDNIIGHNHFWRPGQGWQVLLVDGVDRVYKSTAFADIFALNETPEV